MYLHVSFYSTLYASPFFILALFSHRASSYPAMPKRGGGDSTKSSKFLGPRGQSKWKEIKRKEIHKERKRGFSNEEK
jgi:hypothetical protein